MEEIELIIQTYKEDNPSVFITDDMIKEVIKDNIDLLTKQIRDEIK